MESGSFLRSLEDLCHVPAGSLEPGTAIKSFDKWDSLRVVELVAMLDSDYGVIVDYNKLTGCKTVGDLLNLVETGNAART